MRSIVLIAVILFHGFSISQEQDSISQKQTVIENITLVSPHLNEPMHNATVVITSGKITSIMSPDQVYKHQPNKQPQTLQRNIIDGEGLYLVPGIMDSHVHVSSIPGMGFGVEPVAQKHNELAEAYYQQQPASFLYHGVTQVLDPNPGLNWSRFTETSAHPDFFRCEVVASKNTFPLVEKNDELSKTMFTYLVDEQAGKNTENSPQSIVQRIASSGATCIKLYFEDGYGNESYWPLLSDSTLKRIRTAATKYDLLVLAHANAVDMYEKAIEYDVDVIAHGLWNWNEFAKENDVPPQMATILDVLREKSIGYMPTQRVIAGLGELMLENSHKATEFKKVTPKPLLEWYSQPEAHWFKDDMRQGFDGLPDEVIARIFLTGRINKGEKVMQMLNRKEHPILLGSDFPGSPSFANQPGLTTFLEMKAMANAGISLSDILEASTINNARQFKLQEHYGTVEEGKVANLLLLNQNPLETIDAWNDINQVILHGDVFERDSFAADKKGINGISINEE